VQLLAERRKCAEGRAAQRAEELLTVQASERDAADALAAALQQLGRVAAELDQDKQRQGSEPRSCPVSGSMQSCNDAELHAAVAALEAKCGELQAEVADREARVTALGTELTRLWHHLCVPEAEQRAFLERHAGISDATFDVVTTAIARMQADFAARLTELLAGVRTRIAACWDEMRAGDTQRAEMFGAFFAPTPGACAGASASGRPARARAAPPTAAPFLPPFPLASPALRLPQSPRRKSCTWSTSGTWRT
jgi:hypothetical protein